MARTRSAACRAALVAALALGLGAGVAQATPVRVVFAGTSGAGLPFAGFVEYETELADGDPDDDRGSYVDPSGWLHVEVDDFHHDTVVGPLTIVVRDDDRVDLSAVGGGIVWTDELALASPGVQTPTFAALSEFSLTNWRFGFPPVAPFTSDGLPGGAELAAALVGARLAIRAPLGADYFGVVESAALVPEPGAALLGGFGCGAVARARRRRRARAR